VGGAVRDRIPAYNNGWYRCERTPEAFAEAAKRVLEHGYTAMKFDPFGSAMDRISPFEEDLSLEIVGAVRETTGPHVHLAIEAHSRFTPSEAIRIGRRLEPFKPAWFEEPIPHNNIPAIVEVARHLDVPIGTGESFSSKQQLAELLSYNQIDIINFEPLHMGGILASRKVADMVDAHYGTIIPHAAQGPICTLACLHIDAATPNAWMQETFETFNVPWEKDLLTAFPRLVNGYFELPQGPGLGADLNLDEVLRHPYHENPDLSLFDEDWQFRRSKNN
jgi:galactonate dehydratase